MRSIDVGIKIRDEYLIIGYFKDWLVVQDKNEELFVMEEPSHVYETGTYCDADANLMPINELFEYEEFAREFLEEV